MQQIMGQVDFFLQLWGGGLCMIKMGMSHKFVMTPDVSGALLKSSVRIIIILLS